MSYIGNTNTTQAFTPAVQYFSGNGSTTAFTLSRPVASVAQVQVTIDNVAQNPSSAYTVSANTITFTSAPLSGTNNIYVYYTSPITQVIAPGQGTVTTDSLATLAPGVVISGSSSGDALRITQTGAGNALLVEDSTNPDSTPVVIDASGFVVAGYTARALGGDSITPLVQSHLTNGNAGFGAFRWSANSGGTNIRLVKSRGASIGTNAIVSSGDTLGVIGFDGNDGTAFIPAAYITGAVDGTPGTNDMPGRLVFSTTADGASTPTERMRIDSSGNVGIGTASPSAKLHVSGGQSYVTGASSAGAYSRWYNNAQTTGDFQVGQGWLSVSDNIGVLCNNANAAMILATNGTERMRILSGGQVSVATTTNLGGNLNVDCTNGGTFSAYIRSNTSGGATMGVNANSPCNTHIQFYNSSTGSGSITVNGGAVSYNTSSDYRLKENIAPMTGALAKVAQLKPCTYKWKLDGADGQGFIAHELQEVVPNSVTGEKDAVDADGNPKYQGIDVSFLVATLTAAIQELKAINDTQAETINALTARIVALENR